MKHCRFLLFALLGVALAVPAVAAGCYTPDQFRAEQAVRYHTQLMIVGMRCQRVLSPTAYADYNAFTLRNQTVLRMQENQLIGYYRHAQPGNAERAFHSFRTDLANTISMQANGKNFLPFCRSYANQLQQARMMQPMDFKRWVADIDVKRPAISARPLCGAAQRRQ